MFSFVICANSRPLSDVNANCCDSSVKCLPFFKFQFDQWLAQVKVILDSELDSLTSTFFIFPEKYVSASINESLESKKPR